MGYIHLIMGERGFFWMRRLLHISGGNRPTAFADKYSHDGDLAVAEETVLELLGFFDNVLQTQQAKGKRRSTAHFLQLYWHPAKQASRLHTRRQHIPGR